jgi:hypothetical protein
VVKIRQQLDGELGQSSAKYRNFVVGLRNIVVDEGAYWGCCRVENVSVLASDACRSCETGWGVPQNGEEFAPAISSVFAGIAGLYKGIAPSVLREISYSGIRMGLYEPFKVLLGATDVNTTPLSVKIAAGAMSGTVGSLIANPCDLIKIRCQAEPGKGIGIVEAVQHVLRNEGGIPGLWQGVVPSVQRAALLTATQVPTYDEFKRQALRRGWFEEGLALHFVGSSFAGFLTAMVTNPVDIVKTRMMEQLAHSDSTHLKYTSSWHCATSTIRTEGVAALWKGSLASWARIGPHTTVSLMVFEGIRAAIGAAAM